MSKKRGPKPEHLNIEEDPEAALGRLLGKESGMSKWWNADAMAKELADAGIGGIKIESFYDREIRVRAVDEAGKEIGRKTFTPKDLNLLEGEFVDFVREWRESLG